MSSLESLDEIRTNAASAYRRGMDDVSQQRSRKLTQSRMLTENDIDALAVLEYAAQDILQQLRAAASPAVADVVEGRHDSVAVSILDRHFEGLEVDLADRLLVGPGSQHRSTVAFLIVQSKVLHVSVDAVLLCACDGVCGHSTGQDTVLRVVLEVTA